MRAALLITLSLAELNAMAQISPKYLYNGVKRSFPVEVNRPRGADGDLKIQLLKPVTAEVEAEVAILPGQNDLAKLFPELWTNRNHRFYYAQLTAGGKRVGPALVLQPMNVPPVSRLAKDGKTVEFVPDEDEAFTGYRAYVDQDIEFQTTLGNIRFRLRPDAAPNTAFNVLELAKGGFYRDTIFHRVVALARGNPFVIQGGDPAGTGSGGPGFSYPLENSSLPHDFGVISMPRSTDPNTNGGQIFVCLSREGTARLDGKYASFGEAISGADVILKIAAVKTGKEDRPEDPPVIKRALVFGAAPYGTGKPPVKRPAK